MIVTCEECSTRFQLDEARIPEAGARVRCSRCKHAFFLPNPSTSTEDALHGIAEQTASDPSSQLPGPSEDLGARSAGPPNTDAEVTGAAARLLSSEREAPHSEPDLEEDDWQFSEEVRVEGDDADEGSNLAPEQSVRNVSRVQRSAESGRDFSVSRDAVDFRGGEFSEESLRGPMGSVADESSAGPLFEGLSEGSDFGSIDDFSSLMEDDDLSEGEDGASQVRVRSGAAPAEGEEAADDLGDPESWDLVGSGPSLVEDWGPTLGGPFDVRNSLAAEEFQDAQSHDAFGQIEKNAEYGTGLLLAGVRGKVLRGLGWIACVAAVGGVAFLALRAEWLRSVEMLQTVEVGPLVAETTSAGWIETERAGPVLRFSGRVRNTVAQAVWPGVVRLVLLDDEGSRVEAPPIEAGLPLPEAVLRESSSGALVERAKAASQRHRNTPLAPGEARRFEALLSASQLPRIADRVLLEVGESRLASDVAPALPASP